VTREQALVFGEVAEQYDAARPGYPDEVFDLVLEFGALQPGDAALEIGAGTGKATTGFVARGLDVHALEPSPGMAALLRTKGVTVEETKFDDWAPRAGAFRLVCAAQAWHWVGGEDRCARVARALAPGGTVALFWNHARPHPEPFKTDNDAVYARLAPHMSSSIGAWTADWLVAEFAGCGAFSPVEQRTVTWEGSYTSAEWRRLLATHSDHRMLPDDVRAQLHDEVAAAIDAHGGTLPVVYDTLVYLAQRC
jgi:SAM-dependent methyltransferase